MIISCLPFYELALHINLSEVSRPFSTIKATLASCVFSKLPKLERCPTHGERRQSMHRYFCDDKAEPICSCNKFTSFKTVHNVFYTCILVTIV